MTQKKDPAATGSKGKAFNKKHRNYTSSVENCKVEIYAEGVRFVSPRTVPPGQPDHLKGRKRGDMKGWSKSSRKSMRDYLLTHAPGAGYDSFAVTLTVPGPALTRPEWEKLWKVYRMRLKRAGGGAVWRKELQEKRQAVHWHCLVALPVHRSDKRTYMELVEPWKGPKDWVPHNGYNRVHELYLASKKPRDEYEGMLVHAEIRTLIESGVWESVLKLWQMWFSCLDTLGPGAHENSRGESVEFNTRSELFGADRHAVLVEYLDDSKAGWHRYMLDHTTKAKQAQIAEHCGRHWGVINRKVFRELTPSEEAMQWRIYARMLRAYNRLITPYLRDPEAMFGRRRGRSYRRGVWGSYVAFMNPETARRMLEWAMNENCNTKNIDDEKQRGYRNEHDTKYDRNQPERRAFKPGVSDDSPF